MMQYGDASLNSINILMGYHEVSKITQKLDTYKVNIKLNQLQILSFVSNPGLFFPSAFNTILLSSTFCINSSK